MDCLFCKISQKEIPAEVVYEDDHILAFRDIRPRAPVHILIIPKLHLATANEIEPEHSALIGQMVYVAKLLAIENEVDESGYRLVMNCNKDSGQEVFHLHLHLLAGRHMTWPPG